MVTLVTVNETPDHHHDKSNKTPLLQSKSPHTHPIIAPDFPPHFIPTYQDPSSPLTHHLSHPQQVLIVGAGPSGLLLALLLAKHGIPVHILEAAAELDAQPRAAHYGAPAIPEFVRAGIADKIRERGMVLDTMCWRYPTDHSYMAGFNGKKVMSDVDGVDLRTHCLSLQDLDALMLEEVVDKYRGVVEWEHKVVAVGQDAEGAWCEVEVGASGEKKLVRADYVVGCDGANSIVRRSLFGDEFPGFTWDAQIIATNVSFCSLENGMSARTNWSGRRTTTLRRSLAGTTPTSSSTRNISL